MQSPSLFKLLFNRDTTDAGNAEYLKQLAEEHPYFSPAQFYLLQQQNPNTEDYNKQAAKTAILFNNSYWLNFQLLREQQLAETAEPAIITEEENIPPIENAEPINNEPPIEPEINTFQQKPISFSHENITEDKLIFEPLHTTDYFASQRIKLSEEVQPTDKLGKQLKSFTDWLKTMKKITPDKIQIDHTAQTDSAIQTLAERSNTEGEVLTETMAEIFIQQGKSAKAIETYQKLSLLNPAKSAYFAAKIEQLNQ